MSDISYTIKTLKIELNRLITNDGQELIAISQTIKNVNEIANEFEDMWVGGWGQTDFNQYYDARVRGNYFQADIKYFYNIIEKRCGFNVIKVDKEINEKLAPFKKFKQQLVTELSLIRDQENFNNENELLKSIEKFKWGMEPSDYSKLKQPNQIPIYDYSILSRGIETPPHIAATGYVISMFTKAFSIKSFEELADRILRQVEIKTTLKVSDGDLNYVENVLNDIFNNFHSFCNQLKNRHNSRPTIEISDEYDVQDLLHSILKLHFKDVREEEYTPSYGGSSTRMDFLLKNENIVIEVKKTRERLADKNVGEQLILDVAHYRNHPNCNNLKCFVYDPENRIKNPR